MSCWCKEWCNQNYDVSNDVILKLTLNEVGERWCKQWCNLKVDFEWGRWKMMQAMMQNGGKSGNDDAIDDVIGGEFGL